VPVDANLVVRRDAEQQPVERGVVDLAEAQPVRDVSDTLVVAVLDDVCGVEQFRVP
jgi:hypothetical protein